MSISEKSIALLIDSDSLVTESLSDFLGKSNINVSATDSLDTAYKHLSSENPDVILMDMSMSNHDLFEKIKDKAVAEDIPLIVMSTSTDLSSNVQELVSGVNDYITKPVKPMEALTRINAQLRFLKARRELERKNKELIQMNLLLQEAAITDPLTGLYNKGYILNRLQSDIAHSIRYEEPISFILGDIDHFKGINDTYGHTTGDEVLKCVASVIKNTIREVDIASRYGGEEFLIICPNTDKTGAAILAERIRENVEKLNFSYKKKKIHITISLGVNSAKFKLPTKALDVVGNLIESADSALYTAKSNGRNRVEIYNTMNPKEQEEKPVKTYVQ